MGRPQQWQCLENAATRFERRRTLIAIRDREAVLAPITQRRANFLAKPGQIDDDFSDPRRGETRKVIPNQRRARDRHQRLGQRSVIGRIRSPRPAASTIALTALPAIRRDRGTPHQLRDLPSPACGSHSFLLRPRTHRGRNPLISPRQLPHHPLLQKPPKLPQLRIPRTRIPHILQRQRQSLRYPRLAIPVPEPRENPQHLTCRCIPIKSNQRRNSVSSAPLNHAPASPFERSSAR